MRLWLSLVLLLPVFAMAQKIPHGPVIGAVTHSSARMYIRTYQAANVRVELSANPEFLSPHQYNLVTDASIDHSAIFNLDGLEPAIRYHYRLYVNDTLDSVSGTFRTFPKPGTQGRYSFVTGSCQETGNMKVFDVIPQHDPWFLLHTGDFTYPDYQIAPDYSKDYETVAYSYQKRYDEKRMKEMLRTIPIDYVFDDNDYVGGSGGRYCKNSFNSQFKGAFGAEYTFDIDTFPSFWRRNVIRGYDEFFPHYPLVDTSEGIFHSFKFANAEFFFIDRNSARNTPVSYGFYLNKNKKRWRFDPPNDRRILEEIQMQWLLDGLKNSTADWKFIVSGVPFNKALGEVIKGALKIQKMHARGYSGFHLATGFSYYFAGHPSEQVTLLDYLKKEDIRNVIVLSGDTHHNVMDDGRNAGLPELNASGMSVTGTELGYYVKLMGNLFGVFNYKKKVWNQGGNGLGNKNFKNAFGKITVEGTEYVELSIVDEDNEVISQFRVYHSSHPEYLDLWSE